MVGFRTRLSSFVAVFCLIMLQRANTAIFNSGDLCCARSASPWCWRPAGCCGRSTPRATAGRGASPNLAARARSRMRLLQLELAVGYFLSAWTKARGDTWHNGTAVALSLRIEDLQRFVAPEWLFEQAVLLNLFTWAALAFEAGFFIFVWPRRLRLWVLAAGVLFHLGIDVVPRHRLLQPGDLPRLPRVPPDRDRRPMGREVRPPSARRQRAVRPDR